jgi:flagella synthesis protein FlgN
MAMTSLQQLRSVLLGERDTASALLKLLKSERDALTRSDTEVMNAMSAQKQPLLVKLEQLGRQREAILHAEGFSSDKEGMEAFIENQTAADAAELNAILKSLRLAAHGCRENNQINGGIVNVNRQYLQKAMSILRGRDANATAYGPGGEYTNQVVRQPLLGRV